jgi:hypothetical protein
MINSTQDHPGTTTGGVAFGTVETGTGTAGITGTLLETLIGGGMHQVMMMTTTRSTWPPNMAREKENVLRLFPWQLVYHQCT